MIEDRQGTKRGEGEEEEVNQCLIKSRSSKLKGTLTRSEKLA